MPRCRPYLRHPVRSSASVRSCGVQCPVGADRSRCAMSTQPVSSVQRGCPGVRRKPPASVRSASAVYGPGSPRARRCDGSHRGGRLESAGSPRGIRDRLVLCPSPSLALEPGAGGAASEASPRPRPGRRRRLQAAARRPRLADQGSASRARIARQEGAGWPDWRRRLRSVVIVRGQGRVAWFRRAFEAGLCHEVAATVRPQHVESAARSRLATL